MSVKLPWCSRAAPARSAQAGCINVTAQSSGTHAHAHTCTGRFPFEKEDMWFGADMQTQRTSERLRGAATAAVASGAAPKQRETKSVHSLLFPQPVSQYSAAPRLVMSLSHHFLTCCWHGGQGSVRSLTATTGCNNKSTWTENSHFIFSLKLLLFPPRLHKNPPLSSPSPGIQFYSVNSAAWPCIPPTNIYIILMLFDLCLKQITVSADTYRVKEKEI